MILEIIGWSAAALGVIRIIPQVTKCYKKGNAKGLSRAFLWLWVIGQSLTLVYLTIGFGMSVLPLIAYNIINLGMLGVILKFRYFPRDLPEVKSHALEMFRQSLENNAHEPDWLRGSPDKRV